MAIEAVARWSDGKRQFVGETGSGHAIVMDIRVEDGGRDTGARPLELLLVGQAGCTGMDVVFVLQKMRRDVTGCEVSVKGEPRDTHPKIFTDIHVTYRICGRDLPVKDVLKAIRLSETTYCSASATMAATARIHSSYELTDEATGELVASGPVPAHDEA